MQTAFHEACINRRHRVLGRSLDDFCLYHAQFLSLTENPLWLRHREPTRADLEEAVLLCSLPPERFLRAEIAPRNWRERISRLRWQKQRFDVAAEVIAFADYLADYESLPAVWENAEAKGRALKCPWTLSLAVFIEINSNMREREIMTAPYGFIRWKAEAIAERLGVNLAEVLTEEEISIGEEQRAAMAASGETFSVEATEDES